MTEENLFDTKPNTPDSTPVLPVEDVPSQGDLFADQLAGIKNSEGQPKFKSVDDALASIPHSQDHILNLTTKSKALEDENERLKLEAAKHESVEDVVSRLTALSEGQAPATPQPNVVDPAEINKLVQNALSNDRANQSRQDNKDSVQSFIAEIYGEKSRDVILAKAVELKTTPEKLGELSADNPQLVLALFAEGGAKPANPTSSSVSIPLGTPGPKELEKPSKSLLQGATSKEQADYMRKIRDDVYAKHGVET